MQDEGKSTIGVTSAGDHSAETEQRRRDEQAALRRRIAELEAVEAERVRTEEALRESEERFRALVQHSSDVILLLEADGTMRYVSPSASWILGYAPEQIMGHNLLEYVHPADQGAAGDNLALAMRRPGTPFIYEFRVLHADGSWAYLETVTNSLLNRPSVQAVVVNARDITERRQAEAALRDSEARFRAVVEDQTELIVRWKPDGTSTFVNEAYCRYFGQSREQLIGASFLHLIAEEDRQALLDRVARLTPADPVTTYIHHEAKPDGTPVWLEWTDRALFDENGRLVELQSVGRDVTQRREMEEERERLLAAEREQRELAETLLEMDSILSASLDRERVLSLMLEQLARVVVYDNASVMLVSGNTLDLVAQRGLDSPEPLPPRLQIQDLPHVQEVLESRRPRTIPDIRAAAGWLHQPASPPSGSTEGQHVRCWLGVPLVVQDRAIGLLNLGHAQPGFYDAEHAELVEAFAAHAALAIENARLLEAERQQHRLAEALRHAAAAVSSTLDLDQVLDRILQQVTHVIPGDAAKILLIEDGRARAVRWRGYERFGIQDQIASLAFPVADMQALRQMQETGSPIVIPHTHAYAGWIRVPEMEWLRSYVAAPIRARDKDGVPAVIGFLTVDSATPGFFTGVHADRLQTFADQASMAIQNAHLYEDLRRQMQELQSAQTQLVQSAKMAAIGELAAGVAHELNNPLTSVLGFSELLLRDTEADAPAHNDLAIIVEETRRARDIVRGLLTFAHQTASTPEPADLNQVLQQTLSLIRRQIELRRVTLHETYADDLPYIPLDASRLKQVILNLVTNALDAMPRGGTLTVSTRRVADDLAISFADTGTGIAQDHLPRIFEPFFTTKPTGQGIGLGLSVSLGIIQEHGGRIDVESRVGEGSTFTVWLPGDQEDAPAPPVGPDPEGPPGGA